MICIVTHKRETIEKHFIYTIGIYFFEFINQFRIEEAKTLLRSESSSSLGIKEILYKSGFNNKVSFYNAFKNQVDITPSEYRSKTETIS